MKRIVICADGTWNERDRVDPETKRRHPTNVTKVARAVKPRAANGTDQVVLYLDGLGTGGGLDKFTGGAFGRGIERNIRELYRFIVYNYDAGDELYFFGFSRGAFTVRTLAGFMNKVGLIEKDDDYYVPEIYACYESSAGPGSEQWVNAFHRVKDVRPCPPITMVGVWDTVGALGAPGFLGRLVNPNKYRYHDVGLNPAIRNAFHALAIDEQRKPFAADLWDPPAGWSGNLQQAWFPGVHSNVGGGYSPDGLANEALHWMIEKAEALGLEFDPKYLAFYRPCFNSRLNDSMTTGFKLLGRYQRPIGSHGPGARECVHQAALDRLKNAECAYAPANLSAYLANGATPPYADTTRIPRGTPCKAMESGAP